MCCVQTSGPMIIASAEGGTSIEDLAEHSPEKIIKVVRMIKPLFLLLVYLTN